MKKRFYYVEEIEEDNYVWVVSLNHPESPKSREFSSTHIFREEKDAFKFMEREIRVVFDTMKEQYGMDGDYCFHSYVERYECNSYVILGSKVIDKYCGTIKRMMVN